MRRLLVMIASMAVILLCSCAGGAGQTPDSSHMTQRDASSLQLLLIWDANAAPNNFKPADYSRTLGELYTGTDFNSDMDRMEEAIADALNLVRADVQGESSMGFVHFDDELLE